MRILVPVISLLALAACNKTDVPGDDATTAADGTTTQVVPGPATTETAVVPGATSTVVVPGATSTVVADPGSDRVVIDKNGAKVDVGRATIDVGPTPRATITTRP